MSKDTHIVAKIVEWLDAKVEEQSLPYEVRLESAKLRDRIETWRHELTEDGKEIMSEAESKFYDTHDTMDTTKLAKEILNEHN
jgi:hypothetical protein